MFLLAEYSGNHIFFTTFHPDNHKNLKLTESNLKLLIARTKLFLFGHKLFTITITPSVFAFSFLAIYYGSSVITSNYSTTESVLILTYWSFNLFWSYFLGSSTPVTCASSHLLHSTCAVATLRRRYNQLNEISEGPLRAETLAGSKEQLIALIDEHNEITELVRKFDESIKWILFCVVYILNIVSCSFAGNVINAIVNPDSSNGLRRDGHE